MNIVQLAATGFLAGVVALTEAPPAEAATARVTAATQVRSGPGTSYRAVGQVRRGDRVNVTRCSSARRWCHIQSRHSRNGWVNSRFLDRVSGIPAEDAAAYASMAPADMSAWVDSDPTTQHVFQLESLSLAVWCRDPTGRIPAGLGRLTFCSSFISL